ncbi:Uncharacterised protein [Mycoplasmoides gallisepticum]|uniref:Uncharacterized protein n=1 Tax=Mycoplasmoides gallisepticum TaxID=2096 RepID=A0A3B0PNN0_MYCGL|nr:Uncharacterised protein [Mycoplasmoides gallisepticum]
MNSDLSLALVQALGFGKAPFVAAGTIIDSAVHWNAGNTDEALSSAASKSALLSAS